MDHRKEVREDVHQLWGSTQTGDLAPTPKNYKLFGGCLRKIEFTDSKNDVTNPSKRMDVATIVLRCKRSICMCNWYYLPRRIYICPKNKIHVT